MQTALLIAMVAIVLLIVAVVVLTVFGGGVGNFGGGMSVLQCKAKCEEKCLGHSQGEVFYITECPTYSCVCQFAGGSDSTGRLDSEAGIIPPTG